MWLEITAITLSVIALTAVAIMFILALAGIVDPTTFVRCRDCARWMVDANSRHEPVCFRCRHEHLPHAHLAFVRPHTSH